MLAYAYLRSLRQKCFARIWQKTGNLRLDECIEDLPSLRCCTFEESCKVCGRCMPQHQDPALFPNKTIKFKHFHRDFVKAYECVNKRCDCRVKTYSKLEGLRCAHDYEWDEDETLPDHLKRHIKEVTSYNSSTTLNFYSMFYSIMHITHPSRTSTIVNFYSILLDTYYMHSHTQTHIGANLRGLFQRQRC
jgi:hypothetical protein